MVATIGSGLAPPADSSTDRPRRTPNRPPRGAPGGGRARSAFRTPSCARSRKRSATRCRRRSGRGPPPPGRAPTGCGKTAAVLHPAVRAALGRGQRVFFLTAKTLQQTDRGRHRPRHAGRSLSQPPTARQVQDVRQHRDHLPRGVLSLRQGVRRQAGPHRAAHQPARRRRAPGPRSRSSRPPRSTRSVPSRSASICCPRSISWSATTTMSSTPPSVSAPCCTAARCATRCWSSTRPTTWSIAAASTTRPRSRSDDLDTRPRFLETRSNPVFDELRGAGRRACRRGPSNGSPKASATSGHDEGPADLDDDADLRSPDRIRRRHAELLPLQTRTRDVDRRRPGPRCLFHADPLPPGAVASAATSSSTSPSGTATAAATRSKIFCRDASRFVGEIFDGSASAIAMSATLEPFDFYRDLLGFDAHRTDELYVPSPFPPENRLVIAIDDVDTTYRRRAAHYDRIASWIARLSHPEANVLTLFPELRLSRGGPRPAAAGPPHGHRATPGDHRRRPTRDPRSPAASGEPHLLLAVLGGIFAEGVDYPGDMLSQVIVVSPGLPQYNLERELLKGYYQEFYEHGFGYAYLIPGLTRVVQAAGRLLRSDERSRRHHRHGAAISRSPIHAPAARGVDLRRSRSSDPRRPRSRQFASSSRISSPVSSFEC